MDIQKWLEELRSQLTELSRSGPKYYNPSHNRILPPANIELLDQMLDKFEFALPEYFRQFYNVCGGISLEIHNGYQIDRLERIMENNDNPLEIAGQSGRRVFVFGDDDAHERFAIRPDDDEQAGEVVFLVTALIKDKVYFPDSVMGVILVAPSFELFLERLLEDVKAYRREDEEWKYIGRPSESEGT